MALTLVNPAVFLSDIGVGSPDHHLADIRRVLCSSDERGYAAITPAQEGDLLELQCLWVTQQDAQLGHLCTLLKEPGWWRSEFCVSLPLGDLVPFSFATL